MPSALDVTPIASAADGTQIWKITHNGVDTHPIHFHLYDVQILNRVTWDNIIIPPEPTELGWKDTVRISPLEDTIVAVRPIVPTLPFAVPDSHRPLNPMMPIGAKGDAVGLGLEAGFNNTNTLGTPIAPIENVDADFDWEYVFHCHILSHEEMDMMRPVEVDVPWTVPAAPTGLTFTRGSIILNWTDATPVNYVDPLSWGNPTVGVGGTNPAQEVRFNVWRRVAGIGSFVDIADVPANTTTFTDNDPALIPTTSYEYFVTAWNEMGDSSASNVLLVTGIGASQTVLTSAPNPSTVGQNVTFTATVTSTTTGQPSGGTVEFFDNGVSLGTPVALVDTTATFNTTGLAFGDHPITAVYSGDVVFSPSTSNVVIQSVIDIGTTTALVSNANPSVFGNSVTFTATVAPTSGAAVPTGSVEFFDNGVSLGAPVALVNGSAGFPIASLAVGSHPITATYIPDATLGASSSNIVSQVVNQGTTSAVVTSSLNPSGLGASVTFTATVSVATGAGSPGGTVEFFDNGGSLGAPVGLAGGTATISTAALALGTHPITAVYSGDTNFIGATSAVMNQVVLRATATAVTSNRNPASTFGQSVTFTARVTPVVPTALVPNSGTVQFFVDTVAVGTPVTVNFQGRAAFSTTTLSAGSRAVTAVYSGNPTFAGSTSPVFTQVVNKATASITLSSVPAGNGRVGQSMTFTARVTPLTAVPGTVQFTIDPVGAAPPVAVGGPLTLDATGRATLAPYTFAAPAGNVFISVAYSGNANFNPRTVTFSKQVE